MKKYLIAIVTGLLIAFIFVFSLVYYIFWNFDKQEKQTTIPKKTSQEVTSKSTPITSLSSSWLPFFLQPFPPPPPYSELRDPPPQQIIEKKVTFHGDALDENLGLPVLLYEESAYGNDAMKIWMKKGENEPEILLEARHPKYLQQIFIENVFYLLFAISEKLVAIDPITKKQKVLFAADPPLSYLTYVFPSDDKKRFLIIATYSSKREEEYQLGVYLFDSEKQTKKLFHGISYLPFVVPIDWIEKENLLIVNMEHGPQYIFHLITGAIKKIAGAEASRLKGEKFYVGSIENVRDDCFMTGESPSIYEIRNNKTGKTVGTFGEKGKKIQHIYFSPKRDEILFSISPVLPNCNETETETFYRLNLEKPEQIQKADDYREIFVLWYRERYPTWYPEEYSPQYPKEYSTRREKNNLEVLSERGDLLYTISKYEFISLFYMHE